MVNRSNATIVVTSITLPRSLIEQVDAVAASESRKRSNMIAVALREWLATRAAYSDAPQQRRVRRTVAATADAMHPELHEADERRR